MPNKAMEPTANSVVFLGGAVSRRLILIVRIRFADANELQMAIRSSLGGVAILRYSYPKTSNQ